MYKQSEWMEWILYVIKLKEDLIDSHMKYYSLINAKLNYKFAP